MTEHPSPPNDDDPVIFEIIRLQHAFSQLGMLSVWTIYDHPSDFPDSFVARAFTTGPTNEIILATDLEQLREAFDRAGLVCMARNPNDDPKIVETWL